MANIPSWLWVVFVIILVIALVSFIGGDCSFSIGEFDAGWGTGGN